MTTHQRARSGSRSRDLPHGLNRHRGLRPHQIGRRYRRLRHFETGFCESKDCRCRGDCESPHYWEEWEALFGEPTAVEPELEPEVLLSAWREGVAFAAARPRIAQRLPLALTIGHRLPPVLRERTEPIAPRRHSQELGPRFTTAELPTALREHCDFLSPQLTRRQFLDGDLQRPQLTHQRFINSERGQRALRELADGLGGRTEVFDLFSDHAVCLSALLLFSRFWVRPLWTFTAPAGDATALVMALVTHLFARYPVPTFLLRAFTTGAMPAFKWVCWTILFGQGASLRAAARVFGWRLPRRVIAALQQAPADLEPVAACQWAEIVHCGGTRADLERLRANPAFAIDPSEPALPSLFLRATTTQFLSFWRQTVSFLVRHREEITDESSRLLLAWAMHRFTEDTGFSWAGRTLASASAAALAYDQQRRRPYVEARWAGRGWDWASSEGDPAAWSMVELTSGCELYEEGQAMHHCVAGYARFCCEGHIAIFSLRRAGQRRLTVQVASSAGEPRVFEARGACNRALTTEEEEILRVWLLTLHR